VYTHVGGGTWARVLHVQATASRAEPAKGTAAKKKSQVGVRKKKHMIYIFYSFLFITRSCILYCYFSYRDLQRDDDSGSGGKPAAVGKSTRGESSRSVKKPRAVRFSFFFMLGCLT
jgi:hypothetical protein